MYVLTDRYRSLGYHSHLYYLTVDYLQTIIYKQFHAFNWEKISSYTYSKIKFALTLSSLESQLDSS